MFIYVNFKRIGNFFIWISSILVTTYAVPPRGRRPYTDARLLFLRIQFSLSLRILLPLQLCRRNSVAPHMRASQSVSQLADSSCDQIRFMKSSNDYQGALFQVTCRRTAILGEASAIRLNGTLGERATKEPKLCSNMWGVRLVPIMEGRDGLEEGTDVRLVCCGGNSFLYRAPAGRFGGSGNWSGNSCIRTSGEIRRNLGAHAGVH